MSVMVYKCPQCGASLTFNADVQRWDCKFCLGSYDVETLEKRLAEEAEKEKGLLSEEAGHEGEAEQEQIQVDEEFNQNARAYRCPDCGAEIVTDATTAATFCVFCLLNHYPGTAVGRIPPFKVSRSR